MARPEGLAERVADAALLEGDFVLSSGKRSGFYVDKYLFSTEPALLEDLARALVDEVEKVQKVQGLSDEVHRLAGVELGAVPLVVAASLESGKPYVIVRKAAKEYGTSKLVEGRMQSGERVALIEDVVSTGAQAVASAEALEESGVTVVAIVAVLDRREDEGGETLGRFPFWSLLRMSDLRVVKGV